jgi:hypothetical protein
MFKLCVLLSALASAAAFAPARSAMRSSAMKMSAEGMVGQLAPVGFFDPLGLSSGKTPAELKKYREAELKHGRVAMIAFLGMLTGESFNPFFDGKITGPAIYQFQQADDLVSYFWVIVLFGVALVEGQNILTGWESPAETKNRASGLAGLKEDYVNGDLGFDPLGFKPSDQDEFDVLRTKELQNGRLAMLGVAGIVAQELVNGKGVFENLLA